MSEGEEMVELTNPRVESVCVGPYGETSLLCFTHPVDGADLYVLDGAPLTREDLVFFLAGALQDLATDEELREFGW